MKQDDFIFTFGYQNESALVDGKAKSMLSGKSVEDLLKESHFKMAFCKALSEGDEEGQKLVLKKFNELSGADYPSVNNLKRLFGVFSVPLSVKKVVSV